MVFLDTYARQYLAIQIDRSIGTYVPFVSTGINLFNLFQKLVLSGIREEGVLDNHYFFYLKDKSFFRCILLCIPVLGNIVVAIYDLLTYVDGYYHYRDGKIKERGSNTLFAPNIEEALSSYKVSAEGCSYVKAFAKLAKLYSENKSTLNPREAYMKAFKAYRRGANLGDPECQHQLYNCFEHGLLLTAKNPLAARFWVKKAALNGHQSAIQHLQLSYEKGTGGFPQDLEEAKFWKSLNLSYASEERKESPNWFQRFVLELTS